MWYIISETSHVLTFLLISFEKNESFTKSLSFYFFRDFLYFLPGSDDFVFTTNYFFDSFHARNFTFLKMSKPKELNLSILNPEGVSQITSNTKEWIRKHFAADLFINQLFRPSHKQRSRYGMLGKNFLRYKRECITLLRKFSSRGQKH